MDQIIGAPLQATATANAMMSKEQIKFLMEFCFKKNEDNNFEPVMIEMVIFGSAMDTTAEGDVPVMKQHTTKFNLPLLTLIPINSLAIHSFEVDFDMEITSVEKRESSDTLSQSGDNATEDKLQLMGKISNKSSDQKSRNSQYQKKIDSKLSVNVKGGQLPLPVGLTSIIEVYKNNIAPVEITKK